MHCLGSRSLCCALPEWFGRGHVPLYKYPEEFHKAIWNQGAIDWKKIQWKHILSLARVPRKYKKILGQVQMDYIWGASIVETCFQVMIDLWEMRNEEVHGKEEITIQQKRRKGSNHGSGLTQTRRTSTT